MFNKLRNKKGFTLMEMLIVVAIIAILVAIAIPTFSNSLTKAKVAADVANVRAIYAEHTTDMMLEGETFPADKTAFLDGTVLNYDEKLTWDTTKKKIVYTYGDSEKLELDIPEYDFDN